MFKGTCYVGIISLLVISKYSKVSSDRSSEEDSVCVSPWEKLHRTCIQFINKLPILTWQQSRDACLGMNADLLSINSRQENEKIKKLLKHHVDNTAILEWWIGIRQVNGTWQWVDNEEVYEKMPSWANGFGGNSDSEEENTFLAEQCAVLDYQRHLRDKDCIVELRHYICEKLASTPSTVTPSTETPRNTSAYTTTRKPTNKPVTEYPSNIPTGRQTNKPITGRPHSKSTGKPTQKPNTGKPTGKPPTGRPTEAQETTTKKPKEDKDEFLGCFAVNYEDTCPAVQAFGISWPSSDAGKMVKVSCGKGHAKWKCDKKPTCWKDEPDVKQCTSESIQKLTAQAEEFLANTSDSEQAMAFTENLAASVDSDEAISEQDMFQSTKLMDAASKAKPKNSREAKNIIKNVAKCGSSLVRKDRKNVWSKMSTESRRTVASSLLSSMDSVTKKMLKSFDKPTVENIEEENMAIELQVIDVNQDESSADDAMFQGESNSFAIPPENLKRFSTGGMARLVFINYNNVGPLLIPTDETADDNSDRQVISQVVSASLDEKAEGKPLIKPVLFTMKTRALNQELNQQLCSFWNFSLGYTGAWSRKGCSLKDYNDTHTTCQCDHLTNFAVLMDIHNTKLTPIHATTLSYITYVGIIISIICLFLTWVTFVCLSIRCIQGSRSSHGHGEANEYYGASGSYSGSTAGSRSAQGERNCIHKNLAFCLFIAEILFLAGIERTDNKVACAIIAGFLHYFFLSSFTWMFVEGIHILFMLVQVFDAAKSRLRYYYVIGYGAPLLVIGISALVYYEGYGTERYCWLTTDRMFIWSFAGPVAFILLMNLVVLVYAMSTVCKHSEYVFEEKSMFGSFKAWIQGALAMEVLLGLTWVFGYFYIIEEAIPMAYLFTIFNSTQGLFVFVFHCILNKKVRSEYARFICYPRRPVSSAPPSKGSHQSDKDPRKSSYQMDGTRKQSEFMDLDKDRHPSTKSTTSA
ncbi:adhesion G protein-coupled receptor L4-like isoform X2 [Mercenaria mercenaria]|uniref:adhesion G protein-coupled receptor L4-like isoform X2 n=1 Tax=Mercenaria mercenaria TaxID=6596 RepID=UPI00234E8347|nr:adhesion G protein-coupled receptor L4-like isoform X2 [Mercenaria mercenaria]